MLPVIQFLSAIPGLVRLFELLEKKLKAKKKTTPPPKEEEENEK